MFAAELSGAQAMPQKSYATFGWQPDGQGKLGDKRAFLDSRPTPCNFSQWCMRRIGKRYFANGGDSWTGTKVAASSGRQATWRRCADDISLSRRLAGLIDAANRHFEILKYLESLRGLHCRRAAGRKAKTPKRV